MFVMAIAAPRGFGNQALLAVMHVEAHAVEGMAKDLLGFHMEPLRGKGGVNGWLVSIPHAEGKQFEVIGNIFENPDLLR